MALTMRRRPNDALRLHELEQFAAAAGVPTVVTNDVLYHEPGRRILQDVVTCVRHNCTVDQLGFRRERYADRHLKAPAEMARLHDLTPLLASLGQRHYAFPLPHGRGDDARSGGAGPDPQDKPPRGVKARDMFVPDLHIDTLKAKTRDFR